MENVGGSGIYGGLVESGGQYRNSRDIAEARCLEAACENTTMAISDKCLMGPGNYFTRDKCPLS